MALSAADILASIAPEYAADARADAFLELAAQRLTATTWGGMYAQAAAYLAAHMLTLADEAAEAGDGATAGPVTAKATGDVSIAYGSTAGAMHTSDAMLATTKYGREFLGIRSSRAYRSPRVIRIATV